MVKGRRESRTRVRSTGEVYRKCAETEVNRALRYTFSNPTLTAPWVRGREVEVGRDGREGVVMKLWLSESNSWSKDPAAVDPCKIIGSLQTY
jgi:hypothetical protein